MVLLVVADALVVPRGMNPGRQSMKRHRKKIDTQKVGAGGDGAVGVLRGSGRGVARRGWTWALVGAPRPASRRAGGPLDLSWSSWPGGCRGRVNPPVPVGATGSGRASDAPL